MSAFDDNPFAEDDDESLSYAELASKKRRRDDGTTGVHASGRPPEWRGVSGQLTADTAASHEEVFLHDGGDASAAEIIPTGTLLAEYDAGREEDEFNALVVRAAGLESAIRQQEKEHSDELASVSKENEGLRESVELLKETMLRIRQEMDPFRGVQGGADLHGNARDCEGDARGGGSSTASVELMGVIERELNGLIDAGTELSQCLDAQDSARAIDETPMACIRSYIAGGLDNLPDLTSFDPQAEICRIEAIELAVSSLRDDGNMGCVVPLVRTLVAELKDLVTHYGELYTVTEFLRNRAVSTATALNDLVQNSVEWYTRAANRVVYRGGRDAVNSAYDETYWGVLANQELEVTVRHMESAISQILPTVPVTASHVNTPSLAAAAAVSSCKELESYTEALGREVLWLRRLLTTDTATVLLRLNESQSFHGGPVMDTKAHAAAAADKTRWLMTLEKTLLERVIASESLCRSLCASVNGRSAPAVGMQIIFYRDYVRLQEALLKALRGLNTALRERAHIVSTIRQVALHDGDDEAFAVLAEKVLRGSDCDVGALYEELRKMCAVLLQDFEDEATELLRVQSLKTEQCKGQLQEVRQLFARTVEMIDHLVYGDASGVTGESIAKLPVVMPPEAMEFSLKLALDPCENASAAIVQVVSSYHDQELHEEVHCVKERNEELVKCIRWLSMQPSHSAILQLRAVRKEIDALKHKLATSLQREAKWEVLKDDVDASREEVLAVQAATSAVQVKLDDLRRRLRAPNELGLEQSGQ